MKLYLIPQYSRPDAAEGGIRRVVEAQCKYLPEHGIDIVQSISHADIVATHGSEGIDIPVSIPWVVHCHGLYWAEYQWSGGIQRVNQQVVEAMKRCDHVTVPSQWVAYALQRGMWLKPTVLNHGINIDEWDPGNNLGYVLWNKARTDHV